MIYVPGRPDTASILILEQGHIDQLKAGLTVKSPDGKVLVMFSTDLPWLAGQLRASAAAGILAPVTLDLLHQESLTRPHNATPPDAPLRHIVHKHKPNEEMPQ